MVDRALTSLIQEPSQIQKRLGEAKLRGSRRGAKAKTGHKRGKRRKGRGKKASHKEVGSIR